LETKPRNRELQAIAEEMLGIGGIGSAAIFMVAPGSSGLELGAAAGIDGPALEGLVAAVRNPAHPVARALTDDGPTFDVRPLAPGGPALRAHLALRQPAPAAPTATGVIAVAYEAPLSEGDRDALVALAGRAAAAFAPAP
jgi:hypothetical protein